MLEGDDGKVDVEIPEDIIKEMQYIDLKKIYSELPGVIEKRKNSTVKKLANDFPVFENDKMSLVAVFNEVLLLANEGKVLLVQMEGDVGISVLI
jgi:chromatin segregation and condensation protein Rec8/ScpA/Scc1 (kleisin family)